MRKIVWIVMVVAAALSLAGCGGNEGPSTSINVTFTDFAFSPNQFTVPAGQEIAVHAVNNGAVLHEFVIMKQGVRLTSEITAPDDADVFWRLQADVAQEVDGTFTAPSEPGEYQIVCGVPGHYTSGMVGTLTVVAP